MTDLVERLPYIAAILEANADKFAVPDHISAKVRDIREAASTIEALSERIAVLTEALSMFVDAAKPRGPDGYHEMPRFRAREIEIARSSLTPDLSQ